MKQIIGTADCDFNPLVAHNINHTPGLEEALIRMHQDAYDSRGLKVYLANGLNVKQIGERLAQLAVSFGEPETVFLGGIGDTPLTEESNRAAALAQITNVILLADALREHIKAGNYP